MNLTWADVLKQLYNDFIVADHIAQRHPDLEAGNEVVQLYASLIFHMEEALNVNVQEGKTNAGITEAATSPNAIAEGIECNAGD